MTYILDGIKRDIKIPIILKIKIFLMELISAKKNKNC